MRVIAKDNNSDAKGPIPRLLMQLEFAEDRQLNYCHRNEVAYVQPVWTAAVDTMKPVLDLRLSSH